ncbi:RfaL Lipid A core - O-antigen ligase and related enzymes [Candidatus Methylopumilus universalis]|uniref:O-antigen ligase family protein n=1 Tax=Candidatus Methylopumilus universalis TaxID=2588536 RepID=UPI003BEF34AB
MSRTFFRNKLLYLDLIMLGLMIVSLPSLEAPKNIFLVGYLITRLISEVIQSKQGIKQWKSWDFLFITIIFTAFLSTVFAGFSGLEEWKGFKVFLTAILTGWFLSRTHYSQNQYRIIFLLIVLAIIPPLLWGLYEYLVIHSKKSLEIHSVGHVNHSAIYLTMIFGATLGWFISQFNFKKKNKTTQWQTILIGIMSFVLFISLIIGQSRGAFGIAILLGVCLLFLTNSMKVRIITIVTMLLVITSSMLLESGIIQKQINYQKSNNTLSNRDKVWNVSIEASRFSPLLGLGLSNWHFIKLSQIQKSVEARGEAFNADNYFFPGHSHSLYLSALVERGIVGLMVTLIFMFYWLYDLIKTFKWSKKSSTSYTLWAGSFSAWLATFGIGLVNTTFHHEHGILACLFLGLYISYRNELKPS